MKIHLLLLPAFVPFILDVVTYDYLIRKIFRRFYAGCHNPLDFFICAWDWHRMQRLGCMGVGLWY